MSKWLLAMFLLATSSFGAAVELTVTEEVANNSVTSSSFQGGLDRRLQLMAMTSDGYTWLFYYGGRSVDSLRGVRIDNWGVTYNFIETPLGNATNRGALNVQSFGDTVLVAQEREGNYSAFVLRALATTLELDTIAPTANIGNLDERPGIFMIGNKPASYTTVDDATDSMCIFIADSWPVAGAWRNLSSQVAVKYGSGVRSPTRDANGPFGIFIFETGGANDLNYYDSTAGWVELSGTFMGNSNDFTEQIIMVNDTDGIYCVQGDETGSGDSVYVGTFKLRGVGTGTVTISTPATQQLLAAADNPVNNLAYPNLTAVYGTDSVVAIYLKRENLTNTDSIDIVARISGDAGATWGSEIIMQEAVDGRDKHHLQVPEVTYKDGSGNLIVYAAYTDQQLVDDSVRIVIDTLVPAPAASSRRVILIQ